MAKPMSAPAGIISSEATVLWRDIGINRASGPLRVAGPMYEVTSYETKAECEAAQQAAAMEALSRVGPTSDRMRRRSARDRRSAVAMARHYSKHEAEEPTHQRSHRDTGFPCCSRRG